MSNFEELNLAYWRLTQSHLGSARSGYNLIYLCGVGPTLLAVLRKSLAEREGPPRQKYHSTRLPAAVHCDQEVQNLALFSAASSGQDHPIWPSWKKGSICKSGLRDGSNFASSFMPCSINGSDLVEPDQLKQKPYFKFSRNFTPAEHQIFSCRRRVPASKTCFPFRLTNASSILAGENGSTLGSLAKLHEHYKYTWQ